MPNALLCRIVSKADDLQQRVESFADAVIQFCDGISITPMSERIVKQLVAATTSVAANYRAARRSRSHAEFTARIDLVSEESDECEYWLGLAVRHDLGNATVGSELHGEALQLTKIVSRTAATARSHRRR